MKDEERSTVGEERGEMSRNMICPACKAADLDLCCYEAMMVVREDLALFTLRCPHCGKSVRELRPDKTCPYCGKKVE